MLEIVSRAIFMKQYTVVAMDNKRRYCESNSGAIFRLDFKNAIKFLKLQQ